MTAATTATTATTATALALGAGDMLDSYRIIAPLKTGGMARLYLARREGAAGFSKPVAIKVIHPHLACERDFIDRFITEARLSASISDPNVVHVEGLGEARGTLYIAMEYVHGLSLSDILRELRLANRALSPKAAAFIAARVAIGLHAAHETSDPNGKPLGIIHRDVSPQNILVAFSGHVKVIDFGIAKMERIDIDVETTQGGSIFGKLAYMAPEQARGVTEIDRRADIFALGVVFWELLTRVPLFVADNDVAQRYLLETKPIAPPSTIAPEIPPALDAVVMKALARNREDRYATANELARALSEALPEIRSMEPEDLSALLRAIAPKELEKKRALLASVGPSVGSEDVASTLATTSTDDPDHREREPTTSVRLRPDEALAQLTLPVVPPIVVRGQDPGSIEEIDAAPLPIPMPPEPRRSLAWWMPASALAVGALLVVAVFGAWRVTRRDASLPPTATAATTSTAIAPPEDPPPTIAVSSTTTASSSSSAASAPTRPATPPHVRPAAKTTPARPPGTNKAKCRAIDGVELCQ